MLDAANFGLFFLLYIGLNLVWVCLRSVSMRGRRVRLYPKRLGDSCAGSATIATLLAMLIGLPFTAFLIGSNVLLDCSRKSRCGETAAARSDEDFASSKLMR